MTVEEIFSKVAEHQLAGTEFHFQMADYFDFLSLRGFKRLHEYQYVSESAERRGIHRYYCNHFQKLLKITMPEFDKVIPSSWYNYTRQDVDVETKKKSVKASFDMWTSWERETLDLYEMCYTELTKIGKVAAANKIGCLISDVDMELKRAERMKLDLEAVNYDMVYITEIQSELHECYDQKCKEIGICIC